MDSLRAEPKLPGPAFGHVPVSAPPHAREALHPGAHRRAPVGWVIVAILLLFAVLHVLLRGPITVQGNFNLCDFANHYACGRMWLMGQNPYDAATLPLVWQASDPGPIRVLMEQWYGLLPPGALVALAPLTAMPAWLAAMCWMAFSAACVAIALACVMSLTHIRPMSRTGMLLISGALAAAPFQTLLAVGQLSLPVVTMLILSIWCAQRGRIAWAGILLGLAGALKPQLAAPFGLFYLIHRNWKLSGFALVTCAAMSAIGIAQLEWRGVPWWSDWVANMFASSAPGRANNPRIDAPLRHQMINLSILVHAVCADRSLVRAIILGICLMLVGAYALLARRARLSADSLLSLSILCGLSLLPVYHRSYDAAILVLPYAWALTSLCGPLRHGAWCIIAALAIFLVPFDVFTMLDRKFEILGEVSQTWIWRAIVAPHHAWAALAVTIALIATLLARVRQLTGPPPVISQRDVIQINSHQRAIAMSDQWEQTPAAGSSE